MLANTDGVLVSNNVVVASGDGIYVDNVPNATIRNNKLGVTATM
jgi:parallel beta-helix repeat protein